MATKATIDAAHVPIKPAIVATIPATPILAKAAIPAMIPAVPIPVSMLPTTLRVVPFALLRRLLGSVFCCSG
jgi:hypothetical protein